uniref:Uncharacterized protein n=1 Tax=viral metagenome TaxID=1070528 RepID=A0A6H2A3Q9_9ZZZZ
MSEKKEDLKKRSWATPEEEKQEAEKGKKDEVTFEDIVYNIYLELVKLRVATERGNELYEKALSAKAPSAPSAPAEQAKPPAKRGGKTIDEVKSAFSAETQGLLVFSETDSHIIIKPARYLGSENFAKIAATVRNQGGEYVSAGKDSHFKVAK